MTESKVVNSWIKEASEQVRLEEGREYLIRVLRRRFPRDLHRRRVQSHQRAIAPGSAPRLVRGGDFRVLGG